MKKILYLFLTVSLIFSSCKKEEDEVVTPTAINGCTDSQATNYNANATNDDASCIYNIADAVWAVTSQTVAGANAMTSNLACYLWSNGSFGWEEYDLITEVMIDFGGGPGIGTFSTPGNNIITLDDGADFVASFEVDLMTNNDNMTWRTASADGELVLTLSRAIGVSVDSWK